jgi:hypothetical protein
MTYEQAITKIIITDIFALVSIIELIMVDNGKTSNPISTTMFEPAWTYVMNLIWKTSSEHCPYMIPLA